MKATARAERQAAGAVSPVGNGPLHLALPVPELQRARSAPAPPGCLPTGREESSRWGAALMAAFVFIFPPLGLGFYGASQRGVEGTESARENHLFSDAGVKVLPPQTKEAYSVWRFLQMRHQAAQVSTDKSL